jgi:phosphotransferase system IIA component
VSFGNVIAGDLVSSTASIVNPTYSSSHNLNAGGYEQTATTLSGTDAGNYSFAGYTTPTSNYTVNQLALSLTGTTTAANKVYNGTTAATLSGGTLSGVLSGDTVTLVQSGTFASKNVGTGIAVTATDSVTGADAGNYTVIQPTGLKANITPLAITVTATGTNMTYNGTVNDAVVLASSGVVAGDAVTFSDASATFANANVGTGKAISVTGISISGANASDYTLKNSTATTKANVTPAPLTVTGETASNKVYNGTTTAILTGGSLVGVIGSDTVTLTQAGVFASKNAGNGIAVTAKDTIGGASAGNYTLVEPTGLSANITPKALTVTGTTVSTMVYDGSTTATLTGGVLKGVVSGDTVTLTQSGTFASKDVGSGIAVTATDTISGASAGNYTLTEPTGLTGKIKPLAITVTADASVTEVNGVTTTTVTLASSGVLAGDSVTFTDTSVKAVSAGSGLWTVTIKGIATAGANASDYTVSDTTITTTVP